MDSSKSIKNLTGALRDIQCIQIAESFDLADEHIDDLQTAFDLIVSQVKSLADSLDLKSEKDSSDSKSENDDQPYSQATISVDQPVSGSTPEPTAEIKSAFENAPAPEPGVQPAPIGNVSPLTVDGVHPSISDIDSTQTETGANPEKESDDMAHIIKSTDGVGPDITVWDGDDDHDGKPTPNGALEGQMKNENPDDKPVTEEKPKPWPFGDSADSNSSDTSIEIHTTDPDTAVLKSIDPENEETATAVVPNKEETSTAGEEISHLEDAPSQTPNSNPLENDASGSADAPADDSEDDSKSESGSEDAPGSADDSSDAPEDDKIKESDDKK